MTLLTNTDEPNGSVGSFPLSRENDETSLTVRVMVPIRRTNRFWQMLRDESSSDFVPFGTYSSEDFPTHSLMVVELTGKPKDVSTDLNMFVKYHFTAVVVDDYKSATTIPGIQFEKTETLGYSDPELDINKKSKESTSAFS